MCKTNRSNKFQDTALTFIDQKCSVCVCVFWKAIESTRVKYLHTEDYKMPINENMNKWKAAPCSVTIRINVKIPVLYKGIYTISTMHVKISMLFSHRNGEKGVFNEQTTTDDLEWKSHEQKNEAGGTTLSDAHKVLLSDYNKTYATGVKIENPQINPPI